MFRHLMVGLVISALSSRCGYAITIKNTTLNTTIFSDDFEDDITGTAPDVPPVGTWAILQTTIDANGALLLDAPSPGPKQGTKYLEMKRTGGQNTARLEATFTPLADGETMNATFAFQYVSNGSSSVAGSRTTRSHA